MDKIYYYKCKCGNVIQSHDQDLSALCSDCKEYFAIITDEEELKSARERFGETAAGV